MTKPVNIIDGIYFLGTTPLPDNRGLRELALHWYRLGAADGRQEQQDRVGHLPDRRMREDT